MRTQDLRRALVYFVPAFLNNDPQQIDPTSVLVEFAEQLHKEVVRIGWVASGAAALTKPRWHKTKNASEYGEVLIALLQVAASTFGLAGCVGARIGHGVATIESTLDMRCSLFWW